MAQIKRYNMRRMATSPSSCSDSQCLQYLGIFCQAFFQNISAKRAATLHKKAKRISRFSGRLSKRRRDLKTGKGKHLPGTGGISGSRKVPHDFPKRLDQEVIFPPRSHGDGNKIRNEGRVRAAIFNPEPLFEKLFLKPPAVRSREREAAGPGGN